jgi:hyperosmotically inducible periplasmic protein
MRKRTWVAASALFGTMLIGSACNQAQRERAEQRTETAADRAGGAMSDASITTAVKSKMAADVRMSTLTSVDVDTNGAVVTLSGHVPTEADKTQAETVAKSVDGVARIENKLEVRP